MPRTRALHLSFSACGFLGLYHLGAAAALRTRGRGLLRDVTAMAGASAGAVTAAVLLTSPGRLEDGARFLFSVAEEARTQALGPVTPGFNLMGRLRSAIDSLLPLHAHTLAQGRLYVSLTRVWGGENLLLSNFHSRDELIKVLLASCFIPVYAGLKPVEHMGRLWVDGGLTDSLPLLPMGHTVTFSPFRGRADVSPRDAVWPGVCVRVANQDVTVSMPNLMRVRQALFPPDRRMLEAMYSRGMTDTVHFLRRERWAQ